MHSYVNYLKRGYSKDPKGHWWAFSICCIWDRGNGMPVHLAWSLRTVKGWGTKDVHQWQYHTNWDFLIPIQLINQLESQGVINKTHSLFNSPTWPVQQSIVSPYSLLDYGALNEVVLLCWTCQLHDNQLELKADKCHATIDITNAFFLYSWGKQPYLESLAEGTRGYLRLTPRVLESRL